LKTAVVGIGNILLGDEGVGVQVVEELKKLELPEGIEVYDGATSGIAILNFLEGVDRAIIVDAVKGGGAPGTVYRFRLGDVLDSNDVVSLHDIDFTLAYRVTRDILDLPEDIIVIGIEPERIENSLELSEKVKKVIPEVLNKILEELSINRL
jgi:hydrogenase maturation protease